MSKFGHNPLCQQAMDIDPDVTACICDWVDAAERDTEERIIKLLTTDSIEGRGFYGEKILFSPLALHQGYDADIDDEQLIALIKERSK